MGSLSIWHWLIIAVVVLVAFGGAGKIPRMMGDMAKGIKQFKKGMAEDEDAVPPARIDAKRATDPTVESERVRDTER